MRPSEIWGRLYGFLPPSRPYDCPGDNQECLMLTRLISSTQRVYRGWKSYISQDQANFCRSTWKIGLLSNIEWNNNYVMTSMNIIPMWIQWGVAIIHWHSFKSSLYIYIYIYLTWDVYDIYHNHSTYTPWDTHCIYQTLSFIGCHRISRTIYAIYIKDRKHGMPLYITSIIITSLGHGPSILISWIVMPMSLCRFNLDGQSSACS